MMNLPVDTSKVSFEAMAEPVLDTDWDTGEVKLTKDKTPVYRLQASALFEGRCEVISLRVNSEPKGIGPRTGFVAKNLRLTPWTIGDRSGISYRADSIEPEPPAKS